MLDPQKTLEREAMLKRIRELDAEIAQHERNMREGEARLPIEEQLSLKLRRFIEANIPELAGKYEWKNTANGLLEEVSFRFRVPSNLGRTTKNSPRQGISVEQR